jgi:hypothetical protein
VCMIGGTRVYDWIIMAQKENKLSATGGQYGSTCVNGRLEYLGARTSRPPVLCVAAVFTARSYELTELLGGLHCPSVPGTASPACLQFWPRHGEE